MSVHYPRLRAALEEAFGQILDTAKITRRRKGAEL